MGQDFFKYLPSEITIDILARLCIQAIISCKLVCKPWLDLLTTSEFVKLHLSKSVPRLAICQPESVSKRYKIIEFVNELSDEDNGNIFNFDFPFRVPLLSSANGLLLMQKFESEPFICNPVIREYITLLSPRPTHAMVFFERYGFGVSKMSGDYKVVRIFIEGLPPNDQIGCQVYTIGTRLWRKIAFVNPQKLYNRIAVFLDGNLHWTESKGSSWRIRSLDLET
ncbi:F-box protein At5g49610-like [Salvia hispanica]|uniref:F-box protein At5g49610-like n=1 Tax=Salvia hispanica TaxID=49212 RepID=UPI0020092D34|nr:F-box protein At5g49610-like [Salvia hispanica]